MKEVDLQTLIVNAVRKEGHGMAHKMSHRFLVGVIDLLVKLPHQSATIIEVKLAKFSPGISFKHKVKLDVTHLQKKFMLDYWNTGMHVAIISGIQVEQFLWLACCNLDVAIDLGYTLTVEAHRYNGRDPKEIINMIGEAFR